MKKHFIMAAATIAIGLLVSVSAATAAPNFDPEVFWSQLAENGE